MTSGVMKMKRPFSLRRVGKEWNRENILRFLGYILAAFVINLALECLSRRSLGDGLHYMVTRPWQFFYDSLIILFTLSLSLLFRKRSFCFLLFAAVLDRGLALPILHPARLPRHAVDGARISGCCRPCGTSSRSI